MFRNISLPVCMMCHNIYLSRFTPQYNVHHVAVCVFVCVLLLTHISAELPGLPSLRSSICRWEPTNLNTHTNAKWTLLVGFFYSWQFLKGLCSILRCSNHSYIYTVNMKFPAGAQCYTGGQRCDLMLTSFTVSICTSTPHICICSGS